MVMGCKSVSSHLLRFWWEDAETRSHLDVIRDPDTVHENEAEKITGHYHAIL
jgi:hypothetical protein